MVLACDIAKTLEVFQYGANMLIFQLSLKVCRRWSSYIRLFLVGGRRYTTIYLNIKAFLLVSMLISSGVDGGWERMALWLSGGIPIRIKYQY